MKTSEKGHAILEAALCLPLLILIVMGVVDYGRIFSTNQLAGNASRAGAQVAILHPEIFQGDDIAAGTLEVRNAITSQDAGASADSRLEEVEVSRFAECPGAEVELPYPAKCAGAVGYLRVHVTLPLEPTFRYPAGAFPARVGESAVVRIN